MNKTKNLEAELAKMGITTQEALNEAIRKLPPLNISIMAATRRQQVAE